MKKIFLFIVFMGCINALFSKPDTLLLTKQQMYEDYDEFCNILADVNPQLTVRKKTTSVDILQSILQQRANIDTLTNTAHFIDMLVCGIKMCNDGHATIVARENELHKVLNGDTVKINKITTLLTHSEEMLRKLYSANKINLRLFLDYYEGEYYNLGNFIIKTQEKIDTLLPTAKIIAIGGTAIDVLIEDMAKTFAWDFTRVKRHALLKGSLLVDRQDTVAIDYEYQGIRKSIKFIAGKSIQNTSGGNYLFTAFNEKGFVNYFPNEKILYIRLPKMENDNHFYEQEIIKAAKDEPIEKVVIDIRRNGGGSDRVWMDILSMLLKDTLELKYPIGLKNTGRAIDAMQVSRDTLETVRIPLLDNKEFLVLNWGDRIYPHWQNIDYTGKIYLLQDKFIYSSAGSLSNIAWLYDNIISVGETTGMLLGFGLAPVIFTLPNSFFTFQIEPVIDLTNIKTIRDFYHDNVEIPVNISIEQRAKYFNCVIRGDIYSTNFLFNHDPVFQKVLEQ